MTKSKASILVHNTKWIYISKIAAKVFGLVSVVLVIRQLDVDIFGTYSLLLNTFFVFEVFVLSAVSQTFLRYLPEFIANRDYRRLKKFVRYGFALSIISFVVLFIVIFLTKDLFASFFNITQFDQYFFAFSLFTFFFFIKGLLGVTLKSLLLHKSYAILNILNAGVRTLLYIILLNQLDVNMLLYIEAALAIVFLLPALHIYLRHTHKYNLNTKQIGQTQVTAKRIIRYGVFSMGNVFGQGIVGRKSDYFIVAAISSPYYVGILAFANKLYQMIYQVLPIKDFYSVFRPLFFEKFSKEYCLSEYQRLTYFTIKTLLPLFLFPLFYFLFFGNHIINLIFDPKYHDAFWVIIILFSYLPFVPIFDMVGFTVHLKERVDFELYSKSVLIFSVPLGILGMKYFGLVGIAVATTGGLFVQNVVLWFLMRKYKEVKISFYPLKKYLFFCGTLLPFFVFRTVHLSYITLAGASAIFVFYYAFVLIILKPYNEHEKAIWEKLINTSTVLSKAIAVYNSGHQRMCNIACFGKSNRTNSLE